MKEKLGLGAVALLALGLRLYGLNWDSGTHLHPDERFLTIVGSAIELPAPGEYFDTARSPANPHNVGQSFYVYGTLPLFLFRAVGVATGNSSYAGLVTVQRAISAVADTVTVLLVALLAFRLAPVGKERKAAFLGALLYSFLPYAIQNAHFGTVDALGAMFVAAAMATTFAPGAATLARAFGLGAALGAAAACKPNLVAYAAVPALAWLFSEERKVRAFGLLAVAALSAAIVFRVAQPYAFVGPGFFGLVPNPKWLENLAQLKGLLSLDSWYAPGVQWVDRVFI
ncbi:MAG TPA: hypothetical protein VGR00_06210, partial [Thermoanaerobaculia bacterium]|nr:hypothetical protein [Thermoanaerobaculia bacterium]